MIVKPALIHRIFGIAAAIAVVLAVPATSQILVDDSTTVIQPPLLVLTPDLQPYLALDPVDSITPPEGVRGITGEDFFATSEPVEEPKPEPVKLFNRAFGRYVQSFSRETNRIVDSLHPRYVLRYVSTAGRKSFMTLSPYKLKPSSNASAALKARTPANFTKFYTCDSSVESVALWYMKHYGLSFRIECQPLDSTRPEIGSLTVARAVKRVGGTVVSVMIWNPRMTTTSTGKGKNRKVTNSGLEYTTMIATQERVFRSREYLVAEGTDAMVEFTWKVPYSKLIQRAALKYQIDPHLIAALIQQESNFSKSAISVDSAMGLMQMIPGTAEAMGVKDPMDPNQAIDGGVRYLKMMFRRYHGDPYKALAAYNAGPGNVDKYKGIPPFAETRDYVQRIIERYKERAGGLLAARAEVFNPAAPKAKPPIRAKTSRKRS